MNQAQTRNFFKGVGLGIMVGSTVGMMMKGNSGKSKNSWGKALKSMGEVVENVTGVFGL